MASPASQKSLGAQLRRLRLDKGLSLYGLAKESGLTSATLRNWESNKSEPTVHRLDAVLRLLGGKMTLGGGDGRALRYSLADEMSQMNELLYGATQLLKALEYRLTMINNIAGHVIYDLDGDGWTEIPFDYDTYNIYGGIKKEAPKLDDSRDE